jgi:carbon-monoxide dehydrogenase large subunit
MPRADDFCAFDLGSNVSPTSRNPLGVKGVGEAGTIAASAVVTNAVIDAIRPLGVEYMNMPLSPIRVWEAIQDAQHLQAEAER